MIDVSYDAERKTYDRFLMFRDIRLKEQVYFNFHSLAKVSQVQIFSEGEIHTVALQSPMSYQRIIPTFQIHEVIDCFYSVRNASYELISESQSFWQLTFIDSGECVFTVNQQQFEMKAQQLLLVGPDEPYLITTKQKGKACSYLTISFTSDLRCHPKLNQRSFVLNKKIRDLLNGFIDCSSRKHEGDDDLMIGILKTLLVLLIQSDSPSQNTSAASLAQSRFEDDLINDIIAYMEAHINEMLLLDEICQGFSISKSTLQALFQKHLHCSCKQYFLDQKLQKCRVMIKEQSLTISQIAMQMGFSSVSYFSKKFKEKYGMPPQ